MVTTRINKVCRPFQWPGGTFMWLGGALKKSSNMYYTPSRKKTIVMNGWMNECMDVLKKPYKCLRMPTILAFLNKPG